MRIFLLIVFVASLLAGCSSRGVSVPKPRYHKSWYKNHKWNKRYRVGRLQVKPFEKQGVKKVKMR